LQLADAIKMLLADSGKAERLAKAGKIRAQQLFSAEAMARGTEAVYDELLSSDR
jgi:hypothetical protein